MALHTAGRNDCQVSSKRKASVSQVRTSSQIHDGFLGVQIVKRYINSTSKTVGIVDNTGTRANVTKRSAYKAGFFHLETTIQLPRDQVNSYVDNAKKLAYKQPGINMNIGVGQDYIAALEKEKYPFAGNPSDFEVITIILSIEESLLSQYPEGLYMEGMDIVMGFCDCWSLPAHPSSTYGKITHPANLSDHPCFVFSIRIIDNSGNFPCKFIFIANHVYPVWPEKDITMDDGIYIYRPIASTGVYKSRDTVEIHALEEYENHGLFDTMEDAMTQGNPGKLHELKVSENKRKEADSKSQEIENRILNSQKELETSLLKHQHALEKLQIEREQQMREFTDKRERDQRQHEDNLRREREEHRAEMRRKEEQWEEDRRRLQVKHTYEEQSLQRKDNSEVLKYLPSLIVGLGAAFMAFKSIA